MYKTDTYMVIQTITTLRVLLSVDFEKSSLRPLAL